MLKLCRSIFFWGGGGGGGVIVILLSISVMNRYEHLGVCAQLVHKVKEQLLQKKKVLYVPSGVVS